MTQIAGRTAVVTGAARGLGRGLTETLLARGAHVVAWDRDEVGLKELAGDLDAHGASLSTNVVDVTDRAAVAEAAAAVPGGAAAVSIVINNAGVVSGVPLLELTPERIERTFAVNVLALYWVTQAFLPHLVARGSGHVVTMASAAGLVGVAKQTDYAASKHAAVGFAESLRAEMRTTAPGVKSTVVCPFYIDTGMFAGVQTRVPWLLPILRPSDVVARTVDAIERDRAEVMMPFAINLLSPMRVLPTGLFDRAMDLLGVNATMEHFTGRA